MKPAHLTLCAALLCALPSFAQPLPDGLKIIDHAFPSYLIRAMNEGRTGACTVHYDVLSNETSHIKKVTCSDTVFCRETRRAFSRVTFQTFKDGERDPNVEHFGLTYLMEFSLDRTRTPPETPEKDCPQ